MPSGSIQHQDRMSPRGNGLGDLLEMSHHRRAVGLWHHEGSGFGAFGADGPEDIGPFIACIARCAWACPAFGPDACERPLLADPRFVLEPDFQGLVPSADGEDGLYFRGEVFLNVS